jgi:hypothetical protein
VTMIYAVRRLVVSNLGWFHKTRETLGEHSGRERAININTDVMEAWFNNSLPLGSAPFEIKNLYYDGEDPLQIPTPIKSDVRSIRNQGGGKNWRLAGDAIQGEYYDVRVHDLMIMVFDQSQQRISWVILRHGNDPSRPSPKIEADIYDEVISELGPDSRNMWLPSLGVACVVMGKLQKLYPTIGRLMMTDQLMLEDWRQNLIDSGFVCDDNLPKRLLGALKAKRFAILTGLTGSGKTLLARSFARWITHSDDQYAVVPVGANWIGNENILGYPDALDDTRYHKTLALDLILRAQSILDKPYFLILDEMNLSHVERYFSDFLSAIESPEEPIFLHGDPSPRGDVPPTLSKLPENLYIIGTVNVDETTYMFSPKVLDRANVIEFRAPIEAVEKFLAARGKPDSASLQGAGSSYAQNLINATNDDTAIKISLPVVDAIFVAEVLLLTRLLSEFRMELGFRAITELARYFEFCVRMTVDPSESSSPETCRMALDDVLIQKLLPRIHGSRRKIERLLDNLFIYASLDRQWISNISELGASPSSAIKNYDDIEKVISQGDTEAVSSDFLPISRDKISRMKHMLEDGFASFAEA